MPLTVYTGSILNSLLPQLYSVYKTNIILEGAQLVFHMPVFKSISNLFINTS